MPLTLLFSNNKVHSQIPPLAPMQPGHSTGKDVMPLILLLRDTEVHSQILVLHGTGLPPPLHSRITAQGKDFMGEIFG